MIEATSAFRSAIVGKTRRIYLKAVVDISDPDMTIGAVTSSGLAPWSNSAQLTDKDISAPPRYATLEKNRWLLNVFYSGMDAAVICQRQRFAGVQHLLFFRSS